MGFDDATSRCWLEVDLDAIRANYLSAQQIMGDTAIVIPVLKANAYGMNAVVIAQTLCALGAKLFAVATADECEQLIKAVPGIEVLTLGLVNGGALERLIRAHMPLTLYSHEQGARIQVAAQALNIPARVHVKVDTGLHRLGLEPAQAAAYAAELQAGGMVEIAGLYTHLGIHTPDMDHAQVARLRLVYDELKQHGITVPLVHAVDSIGMVCYPDEHLNAARTGAWLYGVRSAKRPMAELCRPVARFRARVSQVHAVAKGELIGYDDDHPLNRDSIIATVSAGYIDGTPRRGTDWQLEVRGALAPVIGLACMDQLMVDVTDIPGVIEGDIVTFVGGMIDVETYSHMGAFNHNEAWARIGRRVPRVFYENGCASFVTTEL